MIFAPNNPKNSIYIHWPYCSRLCPYCDFNIYRARNQDFEALLNAIIKEIEYWAHQYGNHKLTSIFFGGGTPSLMQAHQIEKILEKCEGLFGFESDIEISLEANPNDWALFANFAKAGINRLSLGVQSFNDESLKFLGRFHDANLARQACDTARNVYENFSIDMIYALPNQNGFMWRQELENAFRFSPDHISPYQLTIEENTAFERKQRRGIIVPPTDLIAAELYDLTDEVLHENGFEKYEISNHARDRKFQSKHNLMYWQSHNWLGVGPGAHGRVWDNGRRATLNLSRPEEYISSINEKSNALEIDEFLSETEAFEEFLIMGLRIHDGIDIETAVPLLKREMLKDLDALGLIVIDNRLRFTKEGQKLSNAIIAKLLS